MKRESSNASVQLALGRRVVFDSNSTPEFGSATRLRLVAICGPGRPVIPNGRKDGSVHFDRIPKILHYFAGDALLKSGLGGAHTELNQRLMYTSA